MQMMKRAWARLKAAWHPAPAPAPAPADLPAWALQAATLLFGREVESAALDRWLKRGLRDSSHRYVCLQGQLGATTYVLDMERRCCWDDTNGSALYFEGAVLTLEGDETRLQFCPTHADLYSVNLAADALIWKECPHGDAMREIARFDPGFAAAAPASH